MIYTYQIDGLTLQTGDIICTMNGKPDILSGEFWRLIGRLVPGDVDHVAICVKPQNVKGELHVEHPHGTDALTLKDKQHPLIIRKLFLEHQTTCLKRFCVRNLDLQRHAIYFDYSPWKFGLLQFDILWYGHHAHNSDYYCSYADGD